jgi:uncharacterized CHY-type Zn-finger protein
MRFIDSQEACSKNGCAHHNTPLDIIAIKFKCCHRYYPCYACHEANAGHLAERWERSERNHKAILCRVCEEEMTIEAYLACAAQCPQCRAPFNPRCEKHWHFYFCL